MLRGVFKLILLVLWFINFGIVDLFSYDEQAYKALNKGKTNLVGADLRNMVLKRKTFENVDFSGSDLSGSIFIDCDFKKVLFDNTKLEYAQFSERCWIKQSKICNGTSFKGSIFHNTTFWYTEIIDSNFKRSTFRKSDFAHGKIINSFFNKSSFFKSSIRFSEISDNTEFKGVIFKNPSDCWGRIFFTHVKIQDAYFDCSKFEDIAFVGTKISKTSMARVEVKHLLFTACELHDVSFKNACLERLIINNVINKGHILGEKLNFKYAHLRECCFLGDLYKRRYLNNAIFYHAFMSNCIFLGIYFHQCKWNSVISEGLGLGHFKDISSDDSNFYDFLMKKGAIVDEQYSDACWLSHTGSSPRALFAEILKKCDEEWILNKVAVANTIKPLFSFW